MRKPAIFFSILFASIAGAHAAELGRLFYTPQQRQQLEYENVRGETSSGSTRGAIVVNGVIQKQGGNRIVWINGKQQPAGYGNEKTPASVPVPVPGKSKPVQVKVGQRVLIDVPPPEDKP